MSLFLLALGGEPCLLKAAGISVQNATVAVDAAEPSYVRHAIDELRQDVKKITGAAPAVSYDLNAPGGGSTTVVVVGRAMAERLAREGAAAGRVTDSDPGPQGFALFASRLAGGRQAIVVAGSDAAGTNYGVMRLRELLAESPSGLSVPDSVNIRDAPKYSVRGIYLHQHWRYNNPYATWSWSVEDWKHGLDLAAHMRCNMVLLWPHMDMLAPPLDASEQDRLADLREVVDYAHRKLNMKVWLIEAANVMLDTPEAKSLPLEARDYYALHFKGKGLKNPGNPKDFAALMANREALYRSVPNADGYGYIDSDPGGWEGSPSSALIDLFVGNRKLLDKYHERPQEAGLIYWVWGSWGTGTVEENWRNAMTDFQRRVSGPKQYLLGWAPHVALAKELGVLGESVFFPYGVIEGEPTFPLTHINFDEIAKAFEFISKYPGTQGVMSNAQTMFVQLPNLYLFSTLAWSGDWRNRDGRAVLRSLATQLLPGQADLLAAGWAQLEKPGTGEAFALAGRLDRLAQSGQTGRLGACGNDIFPNVTMIVRDLATRLRIHGSAERVKQLAGAGGSPQELQTAMEAYFGELLTWQRTTGFFGAYGAGKKVVFDNFIYGPDAQTARAAWLQRTNSPGERKQLEAAIVKDLAAKGYTDWIVEDITGQLFGTAKMGSGDDNPVFRKLPSQQELRPWAKE